MKNQEKDEFYILDQFVRELSIQWRKIQNEKDFSLKNNVSLGLGYAFTDYLYQDYRNNLGDYHLKVINQANKNNPINLIIGIQNTSGRERNANNYTLEMKEKLLSIKDLLIKEAGLKEAKENREYKNENNCNIIFELPENLGLEKAVEKFIQFAILCIENIDGTNRYLYTVWD